MLGDVARWIVPMKWGSDKVEQISILMLNNMIQEGRKHER